MPEEKPNPLDINKLKEVIRQESSRMNLRSFSADGETEFTLALALTAAVKKIFYEKSEMTFSSEPKLEKKTITQFVHKMRVDAMEKFNSTTIFSAIEFMSNKEGIHKPECLITLIVYLEKHFLPEFLRLLQYPYIESDDEIELKDGCGTLANLIAGQYKREMALLGYKDLMMSHFNSYINTAPDGIEIPKGLTEKYEFSFEVEGTRRLVVEVVSAHILPKWQLLDNSPNKKILVVDDDLTLTTIIEPFLKSHNYDVLVAHDGEEGLKKMKWGPDLIVLDVMMPNMDGYEFIQAKKKVEDSKEIPVIVLTAKAGMAEVFKVEGAREYLLKPLQPIALLKSIQRCI